MQYLISFAIFHVDGIGGFGLRNLNAEFPQKNINATNFRRLFQITINAENLLIYNPTMKLAKSQKIKIQIEPTNILIIEPGSIWIMYCFHLMILYPLR